MHFALPPRKTSHPPPYTRTYRSTPIRRKQLQVGAIIACAILVLIYLARRLFAESAERAPPGTPETILVTLLDPDGMSKEYMNRIIENRKYYAAKQGQYLRCLPAWQMSNRHIHRLWHLLPQRYRLRYRQLPSQLGYCSRCPPRHDSSPVLDIFLHSLASCAHHESFPIPQLTHNGPKAHGIDNAQG